MFEQELQSLQGQKKECFKASLKCKSKQEWDTFFNCIGNANFFNLTESFEVCSEPQYFSKDHLKHNSNFCNEISVLGKNCFCNGEVAMLTVAGGLGTRLGFAGPKGLVPVTPIKRKTLFQVFAEKLKALRNKYGKTLHWLIMTSENTDAETRKAFSDNDWYDKDYVHFFKQGTLPAFTMDNTCVLDESGSVHYYPDGHGGVFKALQKSGFLIHLRDWGIKYISYFQVDNPLVSLDDCLFLGVHIYQQSEFSTKVVEKRSPDERVGVFVQGNKYLRLVEYSELPKCLSEEKTTNGALKYRWGNTAIHLLNLDFVEKCSSYALPLHATCKKLKHWKYGNYVEEECYKLEQFIFDALIHAKKTVLFEIKRDQEFSPVKNAAGNDSLDTCLRDQISRWHFWLNKVLKVDNSSEEEENKTKLVEISPLFADNFSDFLEAWKNLKQKPKNLHGLYLG